MFFLIMQKLVMKKQEDDAAWLKSVKEAEARVNARPGIMLSKEELKADEEYYKDKAAGRLRSWDKLMEELGVNVRRRAK